MSTVFDAFAPQLQKVVKERFHTPTNIQREAIPEVLKGKNLLLISETGSGKTESVMLPVFDQFLKKEHTPISILYITPLKSLNRDLLERIRWWAQKLDFEVSVRHGDTSQYERGMQAENPSDMFITTPETLQSMLIGSRLRAHLKNVKWVIVDEIHELVDNKRGAQLSLGLERLRALAGNFQLIGVSATVGSPKKVAAFLGEGFTIIDAAKEKHLKLIVESPVTTAEDREEAVHMLLSPDTAARVRHISDEIRARKAVLVFTNTRESAEVLASRLKVYDSELPLEAHHSSLSREVRIQAEQDFRDQKIRALLCTSSLELGIDIGAIDFVLQFMSPRQVMKFLQRIGRAGHSRDRTSEGAILAGDVDDCFESAVIAKHAILRQIEETQVYDHALDVLGHQIVGLTLDEGALSAEKAFRLVKKAYPYRSLTEGTFFSVCRLMERLGTLWINDKDDAFAEKYRAGQIPKEERFKDKTLNDLVLKRRKSGLLYYYQTLSTIPDVKTYRVQDVYTNKPVGTLDAEFIALHGGQGQSVIVKGQAWRILDVTRTDVLAEPVAGIKAAIPAWEGDLIPVPFEIAQGVGALRAGLARHRDPVAWAMEHYPVTKRTAQKLADAVQEQKASGVPTDKDILIEYNEDTIIFHTCWGSLANDTVGRVLSILLTGKLGSIGLQTDPYRIVLKTVGWGWKDAASLFMGMDPNKIRPLLEEALPSTELYTWRFLHVAKRLGIIAKDADFGKNYLKKICEAYALTPVHTEALNEIFQDKLDIAKAEELVRMMREKKFTITIKEGISPFGARAIAQRYELVAPDRPEAEIFDMFKKRLLATHVALLCCACARWTDIKEAQNVPEQLRCPVCQARLVAIVPKQHLLEAQQIIKKHLDKKLLTESEQHTRDMVLDLGSLGLAHGRDAAIALAGRGVGRKTAGRVLGKLLTGDDLIREVLAMERNFVKTRRFWKG